MNGKRPTETARLMVPERPGAMSAAAARLVGDYRRLVLRRLLVLAALVAPLLVLVTIGMGVGTAGENIGDNWQSFWTALWHFTSGGDRATLALDERIIWDLRAPRVLTAVVAGIGLAIAGLIMQTILRNPLASPYTLGVASAASFGAALAIILKTSVFGFIGDLVPYDLMVVVNAFVFAVGAMLVVYLMTRLQRVTPETIVLLGVAMMFLFDALTALAQYLGRPEEVAQLTYWMFGSLTKTSWTKLGAVAAVVAIAVAIGYRWVWDLNAMLSDDESARSVGTNVEGVRLAGLLLGSLVTATIVAILGPIAFIGLVAPHLGRMIIGGDHRFLIPVTCLLGAIVLTSADIVSRTVNDPVIIPVGIITAFVGVPLLLYLVMRRKEDHW